MYINRSTGNVSIKKVDGSTPLDVSGTTKSSDFYAGDVSETCHGYIRIAKNNGSGGTRSMKLHYACFPLPLCALLPTLVTRRGGSPVLPHELSTLSCQLLLSSPLSPRPRARRQVHAKYVRVGVIPPTTNSTRWGPDWREHGGRYDTTAARAWGEAGASPVSELSGVDS